MKRAAAISNVVCFPRLFWNTVHEGQMYINEPDGFLIHSRKHELGRQAEHFKEQFSSLLGTVGLLLMPRNAPV